MSQPLAWIYRTSPPPTETRTPVQALPIIIPAAVGMIFCLLNASGARLLCLSSGCDIYSGYSLFGVSVDLLGAGAFAAIIGAGLLACRSAQWCFRLYLLLLAGLLLDALFLAWQIAFWPCISCLFVAVMFLLCLLGAFRTFPRFRSKLLYLALLLWFATFAPVAASAAKELLIQPWSALGSEDAPVQVWFSPTCPACRTSVLAILDMPGLREQAAFFPISKSPEDLARLAAMLEVGGEAGLRRLFSEAGPQPQRASWSLRWRLTRNTMVMARMGATTVPLILTPQLIQQTPAAAPLLPLPGADWLPRNLFGAPLLDVGCPLTGNPDEACE